MKKLLIGSASAIALFGLAACSDTDESTTQGVPPATEQPAPSTPPAATPPSTTPPATTPAPGGNPVQ